MMVVSAPKPPGGDPSVALDISLRSGTDSVPGMWAVLLLGDTVDCRPSWEVLGTQRLYLRSENEGPLEAELLWGEFSPGETEAVCQLGTSRYVRQTLTRQLASLPMFGRARLNAEKARAVERAVGAPMRRPSFFQLQVDAGTVGLLERVERASPSLSDPSVLRWQSNDELEVQWSKLNLNAEETVDHLILVVAVLLGVAGSGFIGMIQATWRALGAIRPS